MRVWRRDANGSKQPQAFIDIASKQGAVEVGGGPWWSTWSAQVSCNSDEVAVYEGSTRCWCSTVIKAHLKRWKRPCIIVQRS